MWVIAVPGEEFRSGSWFTQERYARADLEERRSEFWKNQGLIVPEGTTCFQSFYPDDYVNDWALFGHLWDAAEEVGWLVRVGPAKDDGYRAEFARIGEPLLSAEAETAREALALAFVLNKDAFQKEQLLRATLFGEQQ